MLSVSIAFLLSASRRFGGEREDVALVICSVFSLSWVKSYQQDHQMPSWGLKVSDGY